MMVFSRKPFVWFIFLVKVIVSISGESADEKNVRTFLEILNKESAEKESQLVSAQWEFETHSSESSKVKLFQTTLDTIKYAKQRFEDVKNYSRKSFADPDIQRQLKLYSEIGTLALPTEDYQKFQKIISDLETLQLNTTICDYFNKTKCDLHLQPDIQEKLETSHSPQELSYLWTEWRRKTEPQLQNLLENYVRLCNEAATLNNYTNFREYTLRNIDVGDLEQEILALWEPVKPLYFQMHAFVRRKLRDIYGENIISRKGLIPVHLLGNIWGENWSGIAGKVMPYPEQDNPNLTDQMISQNHSLETIHNLAEGFFLSMNFSVPSNLWFDDASPNSDKCHPKIFNFFNGNIRIKDCGGVSIDHYRRAVSSVAKAEYMLQYSHQPYVYQRPADPGLEEAISDAVSLSASTYSNLKKIGLYARETNEKSRLNRLFKLALEKVSLIPFLIIQEFWRWDIYRGTYTSSRLNDLREEFQGISTFTKELSFDPGGPGSVFSKLSLAHHIMGSFLQFQIYESLCQMSLNSQKEGKLDECNLSESPDPGSALRNLMRLGSSKNLTVALSTILKEPKIKPDSLIKFFEPLFKWLKKDNEENEENVGWKKSESLMDMPIKKTRRKRSLEEYPSEEIDDDIEDAPARDFDRFQKFVRKRSKDYSEESEANEGARNNRESEQEGNGKKSIKNKATVTDDSKNKRNTEEDSRRSSNTNQRRSLGKNNKNVKENAKESSEEEKEAENTQKSNKFVSKGQKRHTSSDRFSDQERGNAETNREDKMSQKRSDEYEEHKDYENTANGNSNNGNNVGPGNANDQKARHVRKTWRKQRRHDVEASDQDYPLVQKDASERKRPSRDAHWHTNTKKDISRLLHSFGFAVENDDKEKIKELKKKLKGDSNSDLKSNLAAKENNYDGMMDYNGIKSGDGRTDTGEDKGANRLWSVKSYMTENSNIYQSNPLSDKKETGSNSHSSSSMTGRVPDEKFIGKKETSDEKFARQLSIDVPALQALLKNADLNVKGQKAVYAMSQNSDGAARNDWNQMLGVKSLPYNKYGNIMYKYGTSGETLQSKDKKEYREGTDIGNKSPYIIFLEQVTPEMKERLSDLKGAAVLDADQLAQLQSDSQSEEKKISDKKGRASRRIFIVPVDVKGDQNNPLEPSRYREHEHEAPNDPSPEHYHESEKDKLRFEETSKLDDKNNKYKSGKENPSEFIISWNKDKARRIAKRSKRERNQESEDDDDMKLVRIAPMKESILEGLLGKSLDHANLDDKNMKILFHNSLLSGDSEYSSVSGGGSPAKSPAVPPSRVDHGQLSARPSSPLSSLASSVISALSPKGLSQVAKATGQRQDSDLDEVNVKDTSNSQAVESKDSKDQDAPYLITPGLRCNALTEKKKGSKLYADDESRKFAEVEPAAKGDDACCKKIILTPCPPKCPPPCPYPSPAPSPPPYPCPEMDMSKKNESPPPGCKPECLDLCCKKPSECSLVNCQFKITKAKKPHERLTIMIYDRINPPAELPEPYDALAVISEILQRIQCSSCKQSQLTEEDPDYPANDNSDQLKVNSNQPQDNKAKIQELIGEIPILGNDNPDDEETDDNAQNSQNPSNSNEEDKYQYKEKATPAVDQLTVFNKDKLTPVFIQLRMLCTQNLD